MRIYGDFGTVSLGALLLMNIFYNTFLATHIVFFLLAVICGILHKPVVAAFLIIPFILWFVDRIIRICRTKSVQTATVTSMRSFTKISVPLPTKWRSQSPPLGSYVYLNYSKLSPIQWHPISISRVNMEQGTLDLHIKASGDWSKQMLGLNGDGNSSEPLNEQEVKMDGPFGKLTINLDLHQEIVMVSGGIGCTPMIYTLNQLVDDYRKGIKPLRKVVFIWSLRDVELLEEFAEDLKKAMECDPSVFHVHVCLTAHREGSEEESICNTIPAQYGDEASKPSSSNSKTQIRPAIVVAGKRHELRHVLDFHFGSDNSIQRNIGVLACGPVSLKTETQYICNSFGSKANRTAISVHTELFEL
eukprot:Nk52_evm1s1493 gene=Nk52_evmTU1s1493